MKNRFADTFLEENSHPPELLCTETAYNIKNKKAGPDNVVPCEIDHDLFPHRCN